MAVWYIKTRYRCTINCLKPNVKNGHMSCYILKLGTKALQTNTLHPKNDINLLQYVLKAIDYDNIVTNDFVDYLVCVKDYVIMCSFSHDTAKISINSLLNCKVVEGKIAHYTE